MRMEDSNSIMLGLEILNRGSNHRFDSNCKEGFFNEIIKVKVADLANARCRDCVNTGRDYNVTA